jgi:AbiV family abortive infection protein
MTASRSGRAKPPSRTSELFAQLFGHGDEEAFARLSAGLDAIIEHAETLLDDAAILLSAKRYARADFLLATASEEMGKAYILLDMCRVDFKRQDVLHRLCRWFYNHIYKHVYFDLSARDYPGIWQLDQVEDYFRESAREWWPGSIEDGEPDMPHDTYFLREANLYVDLDSYSGSWIVPSHSAKATLFEFSLFTPLKDARAALTRLKETQQRGLFGNEALRLFNKRMKKLRITRQTAMQDLTESFGAAGKDLEKALGVSFTVFTGSELRRWPMYWIGLNGES